MRRPPARSLDSIPHKRIPGTYCHETEPCYTKGVVATKEAERDNQCRAITMELIQLLIGPLLGGSVAASDVFWTEVMLPELWAKFGSVGLNMEALRHSCQCAAEIIDRLGELCGLVIDPQFSASLQPRRGKSPTSPRDATLQLPLRFVLSIVPTAKSVCPRDWLMEEDRCTAAQQQRPIVREPNNGVLGLDEAEKGLLEHLREAEALLGIAPSVVKRAHGVRGQQPADCYIVCFYSFPWATSKPRQKEGRGCHSDAHKHARKAGRCLPTGGAVARFRFGRRAKTA